MARRRPILKKSSRNPQPRALKYLCESLEPRKYLVVLHAGDVFEFWAENAHYERIVVAGNKGTVELIGSHINLTTGVLTLNNMQGVITSGPDFLPQAGIEFGNQINGGMPPNAQTPNNTNNGGTGNNSNAPIFSDSIYAMYISDSDLSTNIAVAGVPNLGVPTPRDMDPYGGSIGDLRVSVLNNGKTNPLAAPANTGNALLGARTAQLQNQGGGGGNPQSTADIPLLGPFAKPAGTQTIPADITQISPNITMFAGNNIGQFLFGGTIMGNITFHGSVNLFYGGWIITGKSNGDFIGTVSNPRNVLIDGDIRNFIGGASIGTDGAPNSLPNPNVPNFISGFDMHVGGRVGVVWTPGSVFGNIDAVNSPTAPGIPGVPFTQLANNTQVVNGAFGISWNSAQFGGFTGVNNDTPLTAQYLGTINNSGDVVVDGAIQSLSTANDHSANYYGVPLLAGQTITVELTEPTSTNLFNSGFGDVLNPLNVGVFDPDGRLIATDYSRVDPAQITDVPFQFTADRPGVYRIGIGLRFINNTFAATGTVRTFTVYRLLLANVGDLAIGGIVAGQNIVDNLNGGFILGSIVPSTTIAGFRAENGDLGGLFAAGEVLGSVSDTGPGTLLSAVGTNNFTFSTTGAAWTVMVDNGNLRSVEGSSIGLGTGPAATVVGQVGSGAVFGDIPSGYVPNGTIGLLSATSPSNSSGNGNTGILAWNNYVGAAGVELSAQQAAFVAIGGDYQRVSAANVLYGDLVAKGNIGTIRAVSMGTSIPSYFQVNATNDPTKHGIIDLIDVSLNFGILGPGGPGITTGPGGNVRYIHVENLPDMTAGSVFRDIFFGGGSPESTLYQPGETASITDDSGSIVNMTPENPLDSLQVVTYPIRGSGGAVIVQVEVTRVGNVRLAGGVNINTGGGGSAEIGDIFVEGTGIPVAAGTPPATPTTGTATAKFLTPNLPGLPTLATTGNPIDINLTGSAITDVYIIDGPRPIPSADQSLIPATAQVSTIVNQTGGELLNTHLNSLGTITTSGSLGMSVPHATPSSLLGLIHTPLLEDTQHQPLGEPWSYPFVLPTNMIRVLGNVGSMAVAGAAGNMYLGFIVHNSPSTEAIPLVAPALAIPLPAGNTINPSASVAGQLGALTTSMVAGPVVTAGVINSVTAGGMSWWGSGEVGGGGLFSARLIGPVAVHGTMRGAIISATGQLGLTVTGEMINAHVANYARFDFAENRAATIVGASELNTPITRPTLDLVFVRVTGGIVGSEISGNHIGPISVAPTGFGIFDSLIQLQGGNGTLSGVSAGGFGIRDGFIAGGALIGSINVLGDGSNIPVTNFSTLVRQSEIGTLFDPATGLPIDFINDISTYLGTTTATPQLPGVTDTGVIENLTVLGARDISNVNAWSIRGRDLSTNTILAFHGTFPISATQINIANNIANLNVVGPVNGLTLVTGRTGKFHFGGDVGALNMTVAGPISSLVFNSSLVNGSVISASGPSGRIGTITVHGNYEGSITSQGTIQKITIDGSMIGTVHSASLGTLKLTGGLGNGSLLIDGNIGTIQTTGDLSAPGQTLTVNGSLGKLQVGGNLNTDVTVANNLKQLIVAGSILSATNIHVANTVTMMKIGGDFQAGAVTSAHLIKKKLIKGKLLGTITTA